MLVSAIHANPFEEDPFGFKMGMTQDEVRNLEGVVVDTVRAWSDKEILTLSKVPQPHPRFVEYYLYFAKKHGLYSISASSDTIRIGMGGQNIMPKYVELREELTKAYNGYTVSAYVEGVGTWETPGNWMVQVANKSGRPDGRAFLSEWRPIYYKKSKQLSTVELSIRLAEPATFLLILDFSNSFAARY